MGNGQWEVGSGDGKGARGMVKLADLKIDLPPVTVVLGGRPREARVLSLREAVVIAAQVDEDAEAGADKSDADKSGADKSSGGGGDWQARLDREVARAKRYVLEVAASIGYQTEGGLAFSADRQPVEVRRWASGVIRELFGVLSDQEVLVAYSALIAARSPAAMVEAATKNLSTPPT